MRANLLARATAATMRALPASSLASHGSGTRRRLLALSSDCAQPTKSLRMYRSPALVIGPRRILPPVECWLGVRPSQAEKPRALANRSGLRTLAAIAVAV